jgi:hypothetical protein
VIAQFRARDFSHFRTVRDPRGAFFIINLRQVIYYVEKMFISHRRLAAKRAAAREMRLPGIQWSVHHMS